MEELEFIEKEIENSEKWHNTYAVKQLQSIKAKLQAFELIKNKSKKNYNLALVKDSGTYKKYNEQFDYFLKDFQEKCGAFEIWEDDRYTEQEFDTLKGVLKC